MTGAAQCAQSTADEIVIVVPVASLGAIGTRVGFDANPERTLDRIFEPGVARGLARSRAEVDPAYKQLVGYVILRHRDQVFHYLRLRGGGEARLAGQRSIGLGGHLNIGDVAERIDRASLERSVRRELDEEVELDPGSDLSYVGILNDDQTEVGRVHLGVVIALKVVTPRVSLRDRSLGDGRFDQIGALLARSDEFEGWSTLCFPWLAGHN